MNTHAQTHTQRHAHRQRDTQTDVYTNTQTRHIHTYTQRPRHAQLEMGTHRHARIPDCGVSSSSRGPYSLKHSWLFPCVSPVPPPGAMMPHCREDLLPLKHPCSRAWHTEGAWRLWNDCTWTGRQCYPLKAEKLIAGPEPRLVGSDTVRTQS
jgi:hypothetical protein